MCQAVSYERKIGSMENLVRQRFHVVVSRRYGIDTAFIKPRDHHNGAIRIACRPFIFVFKSPPDYTLCFNNQLRITERTLKKPEQPILALLRFGKVEFVKYRKLLLTMENRKIVICSI